MTGICENRKAQNFADATSSKDHREIVNKTIFYIYFLFYERYFVIYWYIYALYFMIARELVVLVISQVA